MRKSSPSSIEHPHSRNSKQENGKTVRKDYNCKCSLCSKTTIVGVHFAHASP